MKKLKFTILLLICSIFLFIPSVTASAESTSEIFYPVGISDYVDLNNINYFAVTDTKIFYAKNDNKVICYDKESKTSTTLSSNGTICNICAEGDYVFIFTTNGTVVYNISTLNSVNLVKKPDSFNSISANYKDGKYYIGFVFNSISPSFKVYEYNGNLEFIKESTYSENIISSYSNSKIAFSEDLIILKPNVGKKIFLFNYPTSNTLNRVLDDSTSIISVFEDSTEIYSMNVIQINTNNYILMGYNNNTMICEFTGTGFKHNSSSNVFNYINTYNNQIYAYNKEFANVCKYSCDADSLVLTNTEIFLAGKGSEVGRFKDISNITYKSGNLYITDSGNSRIQNVYNSSISTINFEGTCSEVVVDTENNYYYVIYDGYNSCLYKNNEQLIQTYNNTHIQSISININNTIYMLTSDGKILTYGSTQEPINLGFSVNSKSKLRINNNLVNINLSVDSIAKNSIFAVSYENKINSVNMTDGSVLKTLTFADNILDFKFNGAYLGNNIDKPVYVLQENGNFTRSSFNEDQTKDFSLTNFNAYTCFSIDVVSGSIQLYNSNLSAIEIYNNAEFSPSTTMLQYYQYTSVSTGSESIWEYGEVKANSLIYDYYYFTGNYVKISSNIPVIVLNASDEFVYVGYYQNNSLNFGYVKRTDMISSNSEDIHSMAVDNNYVIKLRTTLKEVPVYKYPSLNSIKLSTTYTQGSIISSLGKYVSSIDNYEYYVVKLGNVYGYIGANDVVLNTNISKSIKTNAKVKIFDGSEKVNVYLTAEDGASVLCQLPDDFKINVPDYDKNKKYTLVTFIDENQQEREGYILTSYVKMSGISTAVITAIVLLVLDIIIAVVVIVFYHHYKKKQKENTIEKK